MDDMLAHTMFNSSNFKSENEEAAHWTDLLVGSVVDHMYYACYSILCNIR